MGNRLYKRLLEITAAVEAVVAVVASAKKTTREEQERRRRLAFSPANPNFRDFREEKFWDAVRGK